MKEQSFLLHALSPIHAGTGRSVDVIDLPIARQRATGIPIVPGSSIKGVLRDDGRPDDDADARRADDEARRAVFGPESANASDHAGALIVADAILLALPVRSFKGTFVWATSPLLLELAARDLGATPSIPAVEPGKALVHSTCCCLHDKMLLLEDLDLCAKVDDRASAWAAWLGSHIYPGKQLVEKHFAIVDDETMTFLWETRTQLDARVSINDTGTPGALWLEESLPAESVLIGLAAAEPSWLNTKKMSASDVLGYAIRDRVLQVGGKASVGRGRCRFIPVATATTTTALPGPAARQEARRG